MEPSVSLTVAYILPIEFKMVFITIRTGASMTAQKGEFEI